jgi:hypothetical protein
MTTENIYPKALIANNDKKTQSGSHWVAMFISDPTTIFYFDSLGLVPNKCIENFLNKFEHIKMNRKSFQSITSDDCANYCIYYIYKMSLDYNSTDDEKFKGILRILSSQNNPDLFVKKFVSKLLK